MSSQACWVAAGDAVVRLSLRIQPRASRDRICGLHGDRLKLQITAPPVDGAANAAVIAFVAGWLAVPKRAVTLVRGESSRDKTVAIATDRPADLLARIEAEFGAPRADAQERALADAGLS